MTVHHPFSYHLGLFTFTGFGIAVLLAFAIAQIICQRELARRGHDPEPIGDLVFAAVIGGLLGAKIYYVILVGDITTLWSRGGFVFWGGLIGGIIAVFALIHRKRLNTWRISDVAGIGIAAAYSIGRTGCWAVGDDYGRPWASRFAVAFPDGAPPSTAANLAAFHSSIPPGVAPNTVLSVYPTQLLEVALGFGMFLILWHLRKHKHAEGWLLGVYMVLAGVERFFVEFLRAKDDRFFGAFTMAQLFAILFIIAGFTVMRIRRDVRGVARGIYAADVADSAAA
ncbi:MAG TPA: prolipoprotein diacylglyceryl transferase [Gemmatimonadaceae bacterium]|nr:prolipoprotein diacylglyceryl transferase [Gemmatimonadaceae bacterium]